MKREEKWCLMIGVGAVFFAICIVHWYISLPVIGTYFFIRYLKKKKKRKSYVPTTNLTEALHYKRLEDMDIPKTKSPYPPPRMKYRKTVDYVNTERIIAKAQYKPRTCSLCWSIVEDVSIIYCPYCGSSL